MAKPVVLDASTLLNLFSGEGLYQLLFSFLFGMEIWVSIIGGLIALKALPRQQFGALQAKTFPIYFGTCTACSFALLGLWVGKHPETLSYVAHPSIAVVTQAWALAASGVLQTYNFFVVGPDTTKIMFQRHRLERTEKKAYSDADVSDEMKALNKKFGALHGLSTLLNLTGLGLLMFHGLWIANMGI